MKAQLGQDSTDDVTWWDEEMDELEAWTPQESAEFSAFAVSRIADLPD